jgi:hypothetical protein
MRATKLRWRFYRKTGGPPSLGPRCHDYGAGCLSCEMYRHLDEHGRFPTWDEARAISDAILDSRSAKAK